jgi:hypothetical protein
MKSERQNKNRDMLVLVMHLGKNFPDIEDLEKSGDLFLLASDLSYSLFEATELGYTELLKRLKRLNPNVVVTTEVEDERYVSQSGDTVYVLGGKVADEREFIRRWLGKDCW